MARLFCLYCGQAKVLEKRPNGRACSCDASQSLLRKLERRQFEVFGPKLTRLHKGQKILLIFRTWCRFITGAISPNYGTP